MSEVLHEPFGGIHIVHSIPGRVRFRVPMLKTRPNLACGLEPLLSARPGIIKVCVTQRCQSLTVSFEPESQLPQMTSNGEVMRNCAPVFGNADIPESKPIGCRNSSQ